MEIHDNFRFRYIQKYSLHIVLKSFENRVIMTIQTTITLKQEFNADFKKEIIAFANSEGGEIYVGVAKDGTVVGVDNGERVMEQIGSMIRDGIKPDLSAYTSISAISDTGKTIIKITTENSKKYENIL